jgi:hypothetical protein
LVRHRRKFKTEDSVGICVDRGARSNQLTPPATFATNVSPRGNATENPNNRRTATTVQPSYDPRVIQPITRRKHEACRNRGPHVIIDEYMIAPQRSGAHDAVSCGRVSIRCSTLADCAKRSVKKPSDSARAAGEETLLIRHRTLKPALWRDT